MHLIIRCKLLRNNNTKLHCTEVVATALRCFETAGFSGLTGLLRSTASEWLRRSEGEDVRQRAADVQVSNAVFCHVSYSSVLVIYKPIEGTVNIIR